MMTDSSETAPAMPVEEASTLLPASGNEPNSATGDIPLGAVANSPPADAAYDGSSSADGDASELSPIIQQPIAAASTTDEVKAEIGKPDDEGAADPEYTDYFGAACLVCLCCFMPVGIVAVYHAWKAHDYIAEEDAEKAMMETRKARKFVFISLITGAIFITIILIIVLTIKHT